MHRYTLSKSLSACAARTFGKVYKPDNQSTKQTYLFTIYFLFNYNDKIEK